MVLGAGGDRNWASTLVKATAKDHDFTGLGDFTQPYCRYTACQGKARGRGRSVFASFLRGCSRITASG